MAISWVNWKNVVSTCLPEQSHLFPADQLTDRSDRFIAAETVREKLMRVLGQELPYALAVTIDAFLMSRKSLKSLRLFG